MRRCGAWVLAGLLTCAVAWPAPVAAGKLDDTRKRSAAACRHPITKRWNIVTSTTSTVFSCNVRGWRYQQFQQRMQKQAPNLFRFKRGWNVFQGKRNRLEKKFYMDSLAVTKISRGRDWFPIWWVENYRDAPARAALGVFLYKVPNAAQLIATAIGTPARISLAFDRTPPTAYWALWYLGAKKYVDTMIQGFYAKSRRGRGITHHTQFALSVLDRWKLTRAQVRKIESFCKEKVFQPSGFQGATAGCLRFLGRIRTKDSQLQQFLVQYTGSSTSLYSLEAIRALGHMRYRRLRSKLKANLSRAKQRRTRRVKRGRRYKRKTVISYSTHFNAVPSAIALVGLGDRKAYKIVKDWVMTYDKRDFLDNNLAFDKVFTEAAYASPRALKKLRRLLRKAYKKAERAFRKNPRMKRHVRLAAVSLLQIGDRQGLKRVLRVLGDTDKLEIRTLLKELGARPGGTFSGRRGIGHIKVGKGGLKARDAQKIAKTIRKRFIFWRDTTIREHAMQAVADIEALILIAKKRL